MTDRERAKANRKHRWRAIAGGGVIHAWHSGQRRSTTYCGTRQIRSTKSVDGKHCGHCLLLAAASEAKAVGISKEEAAKQEEERQKRSAERRRVRTVVRAIRPECVPEEAWRDGVRALLLLI